MKKPTWPEVCALAEKHNAQYSVRELQRFTRDCAFPPDLIAKFWPKATPRRLAMVQGLTRYHGSPCRKCGATLRTVPGGHCVACERERKLREYHADPQKHMGRARRWARENREYLSVYNRAYYQKNREAAA